MSCVMTTEERISWDIALNSVIDEKVCENDTKFMVFSKLAALYSSAGPIMVFLMITIY